MWTVDMIRRHLIETGSTAFYTEQFNPLGEHYMLNGASVPAAFHPQLRIRRI
jgi:hypothetical protein